MILLRDLTLFMRLHYLIAVILFVTACATVPIPAETLPATTQTPAPSNTPQLPTAEPTETSTPTTTATSTPRPTNPPAIDDATPQPVSTPWSCGTYPCNEDIDGWVERIQLPPGFTASYLGSLPEGEHFTSLTFGPDERLYAATMEGNIYYFESASRPVLFKTGFYIPIGLAFHPETGDLYIASRSFPPETVPNAGKVTVIQPDGTQRDILTDLPCCYTLREHQPNSIAFGPDGKVYLSIGALGDHGETAIQPDGSAKLTPYEAGILRFNLDGSELERYAVGFRNPYDLTFDANGELFATDNGPDYGPLERLHRVEQDGNYGYPYYPDCEFCPQPPAGLMITPPIAEFISHGAATGILAYTASQYPANYYNNLFVTLWSAFPGAQKIVRISTSPDIIAHDFMLGLAAPIDVAQSPEGSIVVGDWATGHIFAINYAP
jgi:glucose/arabinose dehydrogenase